MAICWERAVPFAFRVCCFYFGAILIVGVPFPFRAGCGIRLYRFLIVAFLSTMKNENKNVTFTNNVFYRNGLSNQRHL